MIEFDVEAMTCGHCVSVVTRAVKLADPNATVEVDLDKKKVKVETTRDRAVIAAALMDAGYPPA